MMKQLSATDKQLILATQAGLPLCAKPYQQLAQQLQLTEQQVIAKLEQFIQCGIIRRIAVVPNHYKLGYTANAMSVWDIDDDFIDALGEKMAQLPFVSHCYQRPRHLPIWPYNLFIMLHAKDKSTIHTQIQQIKQQLQPHYQRYELLYSSKILKKTGLRLNP